MKFIKINEAQKNRIFEAYQNGFSFEELSILGNDAFSNWEDWKKQYDYCAKWLGEPFSEGSSRCVFTLNDSLILKLAYGARYNAGIEQNRLEYEMYQKIDSPLLAKVMYCDDNFTFLICENAVPAEPVDFEKILGIPFYSSYHQRTKPVKSPYSYNGGHRSVGYDKYFGSNLKNFGEEYNGHCIYNIMAYIEANYVLHQDYFNLEIEKTILHNKWLKEFRELIKETEIGDFCKYNNFGVVNRNGTPTLVILDAGMTMDVWKKHYSI